MPMVLSSDSRIIAGIILLTIVGIEYGGWFMLRVVRGNQPATPFQQAFFRAGHAHAGVLVILSLVSQFYADATHLSGPLVFIAHNAIPLAAILIPGGFFFAAIGRDVKKPNGFIWLIYLGIASLGLGVVTLGIGLLMA